MTALEALRQLALEEHRKKYPTMPDRARYINTFDKLKPEKKEKKRIEKFLNLRGHYASIIENRGQKIDRSYRFVDAVGFQREVKDVQWIGSGMRKGLADLKCSIKGKAVDIELKRIYKKGKDRMSEHQIKEQQRMTADGGIFLIVNSFEDFYQWYVKNIDKL